MLSIAACTTKQVAVHSAPLANKTDSLNAKIKFQTKKTYRFNQSEIILTNEFSAARLSSVTQQNDSTFNVTISPENTPINPSPWYAFKLWSATRKNITINLNYVGTKHRYDPKIFQNQTWLSIDKVQLSTDKKTASFTVNSGSDTLLIAAQELLDVADNSKWEDSLAKLPDVKAQIIGYSMLHKPIRALSIGGGKGKKMIVVLSRQHPPEVTGYMAMQEFIRTIVANTTLAKNFRQSYETVLIPMVNPDGVDEGNWRHSVAGVDLNRDWEFFKQPETKSIKAYLLQKIAKQDGKVYFGIDFHSTYNDVFYTNEDQPANQTNAPGFTNRWLDAFQKAIPGFKPNIKPSPNGGNVSKSWMGRVLHAEALTYEVGDDTPRPTLKMKGKVAAEAMMRLLLAEQ